jgi:outer membrane autotransporter protein
MSKTLKKAARARVVMALKKPIAVAVIAVAAGAGISAEALAACSNPVGNPSLPSGYNSWGPSAICAGVSAGSSITSALTTMDIAFLTQNTALVGSPNSPVPNQPGSGIWIRGVAGENTISSSSTAVGVPVGGTYAADSRSRLDFGGFQAGVDMGRFNIGASGLNVIAGIMGGVLAATDHELAGPGKYTFDVPFVGAYVVLTKGNFFADVQVRGDFYDINASNTNVGLVNGGISGNGINVAGSTGYKFDIGSYFIEPSIGLVWSHLNLGTLAVPGGGPFGVPAGFYSFDPIDSLVGRAGVRVGTAFQSGNLLLQPFFSASIWDEFAGRATSSFNCPAACNFSLNLDTSRVGTFGQFGLGVAGQIANTGWLGYVRADYRTGENIEGWGFSGGLRYQFALDAPLSKLITK